MNAQRARGRGGKPGAAADPVRELSVRLLVEWQLGSSTAENLVHDATERGILRSETHELAARRRLRELVFGCVRLRGRYDHLIMELTRKAPEPALRAVLWLGLHELCELSTPPHAAVSSSVDLARGMGLGHAAGFVNGILRRVQREGAESFFPRREEDPLAHASTWLSHPRWLVERWAARLGSKECLALCEADNRRPTLVLRGGSGRGPELLAAIEALGWEGEAGRWSRDAVRLGTRVPAPLVLEQLPPPVSIQDEAAQIVPELFLPERPRLVLDLCAAPGGKALQLSEILGPDTRVLAADLDRTRLQRLGDSVQRLERPNLRLIQADGRRAPFAPAGFDAILVDAPCTGTGVLARRHEARWRRSPSDLRDLPVLQRELLHSAVDLCRPGGIIVYATCSLEPEENDEVVDRVLAERTDLRELGVQARVAAELQRDQRLEVWPQRHGCDGAFAAVLQRTERTT